ncbi:protein CMSS1 isoform X1 [Girardinichthys multiradiatus]|uniref:protein CMSS1 isoform X1 n=1 Tax=Girardinichthys multiradiatus TaxID=208333 RepID=UPI001FAE6AF4|nr:protein CMSS1 isoform X1 [Girardinichthys multiradiatus]XP_047226055.1 protein CMSS1 isoform X1 [Girardinichthys multiradiatus]
MGDDLGDDWWKHKDASEAEEETEQEKQPAEKAKTKPEKRKRMTEKSPKAKKKKNNDQKEFTVPHKKEVEEEQSTEHRRKRKRKKKTITDILATSEPKPGSAADLQDLVTQYFSDKRSVIELEDLKLQNSSFLSSNDLTHTLSSYLKQVCPKWAKIQKQHTEKSSVVILIVCSSALRTIDLIKQLTAFKGEAKAVKLFAKHIKIEEQVKLLQKGITHIGVGTPGRISALIEKEGLNLQALKYLIVDWNWRDQKLRRMLDIPEIKLDFMKLLESGVLTACKEDKVKIGLF